MKGCWAAWEQSKFRNNIPFTVKQGQGVWVWEGFGLTIRLGFLDDQEKLELDLQYAIHFPPETIQTVFET